MLAQGEDRVLGAEPDAFDVYGMREVPDFFCGEGRGSGWLALVTGWVGRMGRGGMLEKWDEMGWRIGEGRLFPCRELWSM